MLMRIGFDNRIFFFLNRIDAYVRTEECHKRENAFGGDVLRIYSHIIDSMVYSN